MYDKEIKEFGIPLISYFLSLILIALYRGSYIELRCDLDWLRFNVRWFQVLLFGASKISDRFQRNVKEILIRFQPVWETTK